MVTLKDAKEATTSIVKTLQPLSVILFGSVAKDGAGTDLDILVVTEDESESREKSEILLHKCLKKFYRRFDIDPFVIPRSLLKEYYFKGSPFLRLISSEGRILYMKNAVQEWIAQSKNELEMADYLMKGEFFRGACYHAQQSIEKILKAALIRKGWDLEKTHSIERLKAIGEDYGLKLSISDEDLIFVDSICRGRYPAEAGLLPLGEPTEKDAKKAVTIARRISREMLKQIKL
jgi:HEPN domain-containing protein/predicted nucleotidyltransferase